MNGRFITIEGIEGVGKSTVLSHLLAWLESNNVDHLVTREPGGTVIAEAIRQILLSHYNNEVMESDTELLLVFAARAQHIQQVILPALSQGLCVVSDRFTDASYAYQGGGRGLDPKRIAVLENWVQGSLRPDLTILLDAPLDVAFARATSRSLPDRIEVEGRTFFEKVRQTYLDRARDDPKRFAIIDANRALSLVQNDVIEVVKQYVSTLA